MVRIQDAIPATPPAFQETWSTVVSVIAAAYSVDPPATIVNGGTQGTPPAHRFHAPTRRTAAATLSPFRGLNLQRMEAATAPVGNTTRVLDVLSAPTVVSSPLRAPLFPAPSYVIATTVRRM